MELQVRRGIPVSAEAMRHCLHELGWAWKRAKVAAKDDDPDRVEKLARIRLAFEQLRAGMPRSLPMSWTSIDLMRNKL